jgi:hypothetical protein
MTDHIDQDAELSTEVAAETMHGDLMAIVIDEMKALPDVWQKLAEAEQRELIERVKTRTRDAVEECVRIIATAGFTRIRASVESVTVKDGIKAQFALSKFDAARHDLIDAQGSTVFIVLADPEAFAGGTEQVKPDPDQGALVLDAVEKIGKKRDGDGEQQEAA